MIIEWYNDYYSLVGEKIHTIEEWISTFCRKFILVNCNKANIIIIFFTKYHPSFDHRIKTSHFSLCHMMYSITYNGVLVIIHAMLHPNIKHCNSGKATTSKPQGIIALMLLGHSSHYRFPIQLVYGSFKTSRSNDIFPTFWLILFFITTLQNTGFKSRWLLLYLYKPRII